MTIPTLSVQRQKPSNQISYAWQIQTNVQYQVSFSPLCNVISIKCVKGYLTLNPLNLCAGFSCGQYLVSLHMQINKYYKTFVTTNIKAKPTMRVTGSKLVISLPGQYSALPIENNAGKSARVSIYCTNALTSMAAVCNIFQDH